MSWKLKRDDDGNVQFETQKDDDGNVIAEKPVYIDPDGKELALDPPGMYNKIIDLGKESKKHRESAQQIKNQYKLLEDIEDLEEWKKKADEAMQTVANLNDGDWLKADKVEKLKEEMRDSYEAKMTAAHASYQEKEKSWEQVVGIKDSQIRELMVSNRFATSPLFSGSNPRTNLPPAVAESFFGKYFEVEEDPKTRKLKLMAYYDEGHNEPVTSKENPGEPADFSEAIELIFDKSPYRDQLLKSTPSGSGSHGGSDGGDPKSKLDELTDKLRAAQEAGDARTMIALKNQIAELRRKAA